MTNETSILPGIVANLRAVKWNRIPELSLKCGVPESTIKKIRSGEVQDPRVSTVEALRDFFALRNP